MKLPDEYKYIRKMIDIDPQLAVEMAYETGVKDGVIKQLKQLKEELNSLRAERK
jgi:hypothetical protein